MYYYAQIDENNICVGLSETSLPINNPRAIPRRDGDGSDLGKLYNNGTWEDGPGLPPEPLSETEQAILDTAVNTDYLVCLADLGV